MTSLVGFQGDGTGGRTSYCLVFFGTSRPVSKVTWNRQRHLHEFGNMFDNWLEF